MTDRAVAAAPTALLWLFLAACIDENAVSSGPSTLAASRSGSDSSQAKRPELSSSLHRPHPLQRSGSWSHLALPRDPMPKPEAISVMQGNLQASISAGGGVAFPFAKMMTADTGRALREAFGSLPPGGCYR